MNTLPLSTRRFIQLLTVVLGTSLLLVPAEAAAVTSSSPTSTGTISAAHMTVIKTTANNEIIRRLNQLDKLDSLISAAKHLTASDQSTLTNEVNTEISGLTALKTKIDGDTDGTTLRTDVQSIVTDYRVYALITPKVWLIKTADDQQTAEAKLSALITKFETRINAAKSQGKEVTALQNALDDMTMQVKNSQAISSAVEAKVLPLQPSDYDSDHTILSGDATQLQTAHQDNVAAYNDAKTIVSGLKNL